jgi:hypothetical protein
VDVYGRVELSDTGLSPDPLIVSLVQVAASLADQAMKGDAIEFLNDQCPASASSTARGALSIDNRYSKNHVRAHAAVLCG